MLYNNLYNGNSIYYNIHYIFVNYCNYYYIKISLNYFFAIKNLRIYTLEY